MVTRVASQAYAAAIRGVHFHAAARKIVRMTQYVDTVLVARALNAAVDQPGSP